MKIAILTSVYPGAKDYFFEFLDSLNNQSTSSFDLVIANNAMPNINTFVAKYKGRFFIIEAKGTPVQLRKAMIKFALSKNYNWLVFMDADDTATSNRMRILSKNMEQDRSAILVNDLHPFGENIRYHTSLLSPHFKDGDLITIDSLLDGNILGLSNTAARSNTIEKYYELPDDNLVAYDWALFSLALEKNEVTRFTTGAGTNYRQHRQNIALLTDDDLKTILKKLTIKEAHYKFMATKNQKYAIKLNQTRVLYDQLKNDDVFADKYVRFAVKNSKGKLPFWWRTPEMDNQQ